MINGKRILCVIPARGGSKGIKNKNLLKIGNESLVAITSKFALSCNIFDHIHLSTDSSDIQKEGVSNLIECSFLRPKYLSGDRVADIPVLIYCSKMIEKKFSINFDYIVMFQVTSPFRKKKDIIKSIKMMINNKFDSLISITSIDKKYHYLKQLEFKNHKIKFSNKNGNKVVARQQLNQTFIRNGVIYIFDKNKLYKRKELISNNSFGYEIKDQVVNIDTIEDLTLARNIDKKLSKKK